MTNKTSSQKDAIPVEQWERLEQLLPEARKVMQNAEDRLLAVALVAHERWTPGAEAHDYDETSPPVFGDEDYAQFLGSAQSVHDVALFGATASFLGIAEDIVVSIQHKMLEAVFVRPSSKQSGGGVVSHKAHGKESK